MFDLLCVMDPDNLIFSCFILNKALCKVSSSIPNAKASEVNSSRLSDHFFPTRFDNKAFNRSSVNPCNVQPHQQFLLVKNWLVAEIQ